MIIKKINNLLVVLIVLAFIAGCSEVNNEYKGTETTAFNTKQSIKQATIKATTELPPVVTEAGFYVDTTPIAVKDHPLWLSNTITLRGNELPLSFLTSRILRNSSAVVTYGEGVNSEKAISIDYHGTIEGALESLALKTDYSYLIKGNQINWSDYITKTFDISFMPGTSAYMVGQKQGDGGAQASRGGMDVVSGSLDSQQYTSLSGNFSVWSGLQATLNNLKSKDGSIEVSEATTSVTVHDHPDNVRAMEQYINQLNENLSRQVELKVKVLEIDLDKAHQYGIDWSIVQKIAGHVSIGLAGVSSDAVTIAETGLSNPASLLVGNSSGNNALLRALGEQGKLSIVTEPTVITMNNQVAEVRISRDTGYVKKFEQSVSGGGSDATVSTTMEPGVVTDGFAMYLLPKIENNKVYLQVTSTISKLQKLDTKSSQPIAGTNTSIVTIQIPTLAEKRFNMRSLLDNGATLVLAGFRQLSDQNKKVTLFGSSALGGKGTSVTNTETIILITPTIIENKN